MYGQLPYRVQQTGDVFAEIAADRLVYVDRRNNVLKLAQGEFVALSHLEAVYAGAHLVRQIFVYGNSRRASLLAVVVPTPEALARHDPDGLKVALAESLQRAAKEAELQVAIGDTEDHRNATAAFVANRLYEFNNPGAGAAQ